MSDDGAGDGEWLAAIADGLIFRPPTQPGNEAKQVTEMARC